jgi:hypothetical protein
MMKYHHGGVLCAPKCIKLIQIFLAQTQKVNSTVKKLAFSAWVWVVSGRKCKFIFLNEKKGLSDIITSQIFHGFSLQCINVLKF